MRKAFYYLLSAVDFLPYALMAVGVSTAAQAALLWFHGDTTPFRTLALLVFS